MVYENTWVDEVNKSEEFIQGILYGSACKYDSTPGAEGIQCFSSMNFAILNLVSFITDQKVSDILKACTMYSKGIV